jgi:predicted DNA binding CopG/RHH family protein
MTNKRAKSIEIISQKNSERITFRVSAEMMKAVELKAKLMGMSVSSYLRKLIFDSL